MRYKVEVEVQFREIWEHIDTGTRCTVKETLPDEVKLMRDGDIISESPQAFVDNYRMVSSPLRGSVLMVCEALEVF